MRPIRHFTRIVSGVVLKLQDDHLLITNRGTARLRQRTASSKGYSTCGVYAEELDRTTGKDLVEDEARLEPLLEMEIASRLVKLQVGTAMIDDVNVAKADGLTPLHALGCQHFSHS